jgi:peptide/nickel transport system permease protein
MNPFKNYGEKLLQKARQALLQKRALDANRIARKALKIDNSLEEAWLILAVTSDAEESLAYLQKVLTINPNNKKAIKGSRWLQTKLDSKTSDISLSSIVDIDFMPDIHESEFRTQYGKSFFERISSRWQTLFALTCISLIVFIAVTAPLLAPVSVGDSSPWFKVVCERYSCTPLPPNEFSPLGTVKEFDVYHTLIWGVRQSLIFGLLTALISATIGTLLGLVSAYYGGWFDRLIMRICDAFLAFPIVAGVALFAQASTLLASSAAGLHSNSLNGSPADFNIIQTVLMNLDPILIALIFFSWMGYTRIIHSQVLWVKKEEYIEAARTCGASHNRIIFKHILPNAITPSVVMATRDVGRMVVIQSSLTFIGVGGSSAWATLLNIGKNWIIGPGGNLLVRWWVYLPITLALVFFGITWGIMGDELNHWMNPKNS